MNLLLYCVALLPIVWLILALTVFRLPGHLACLSSLGLAAILALTLWEMPVIDCGRAALEGFASALWPIILVIVAAIFLYNLTLKTGAMEVIKTLLTGVSRDRRVQVLLIGWCFGGFLEGMAGFGTAVAIPAGILAGMGMNPVLACLACMLSNAFPTAFGSVAIPTITLSNITGLEALPLGFVTVVQMLPFMILVPFLMVVVGGGGFKALKGMVGITLVSGLSFVTPQLIIAYFVGPELAVVIGSVVSLLVVVLMAGARKHQPVPAEYDLGAPASAGGSQRSGSMSPFIAFLPFVLVLVFLLVTSKVVPPVNTFLAQFSSSFQIGPQGTTSFAWVNTPGVLIILAAVIGGLIQGARFGEMLQVFAATLKQLTKTILTIMSVLAMAKIMTYSGMIGDIAALFVTLTGSFYPFVSPIIAAIGAFVTGSGTNTEVLIGPLQVTAAQQLDISQFWLAGANSVGAGIGKILSPQCIATAVAAVGLTGQDSTLLKGIFKWAMLLLVLACLLIGLLAGVMPGWIQSLLPGYTMI